MKRGGAINRASRQARFLRSKRERPLLQECRRITPPATTTKEDHFADHADSRSSPRPVTRPAAQTAALGARAALIATAAALGIAGPATAQNVAVSPADRKALEGSSSTSYPLGRHNCRLQQLHADLGDAPATLAGHSYRRDAISQRGNLNGYRVEMSVAISLAAVTPDQASRTFANNAGTPVVVLPRTWVSMPATTRPGGAPAPQFELRVPYTTPFAYPGNGTTICLDTTVYGNDGPNGINANFTAYQDAHELFDDGTCEQPGYRFGQGCAAPGTSTEAYANLTLRHTPVAMELDVDARYGMPTDPSGAGLSALLVGLQASSQPISITPSCQLLVQPTEVYPLPGSNNQTGHWSGTLTAATTLPIGARFYVQVASGHPVNGVTLSDGSVVTPPPLGAVPIAAVRIAHGSDNNSPTGTVSQTVPVTEFF